MQNKKRYILFAIIVILLAGAAFVGGKMLNGQTGPLGFLPRVDLTPIAITPAPELPARQPETIGTFVERNDNTLKIQTVSIEMGNGENTGPIVEVVTTNQTLIYRDITELNKDATFDQQVVRVGVLDELKSQSMVMVWGRRNGDRIIADVISYSNPIIFDK